MTSILPCMQYSTQERSLDRRQEKRNILWSGYCQTQQHRFSMQVMSGQLRAFVEKETYLVSTRDPRDYLPDVKDGLTSRERIVLQCLDDLQQARGGRHVPTGMLYGSVVEHVDMSVEEMQGILVRLIGHPLNS